MSQQQAYIKLEKHTSGIYLTEVTCPFCSNKDEVLVTVKGVPQAYALDDDVKIVFSIEDLFDEKNTKWATYYCKNCLATPNIGANLDTKSEPKPTLTFFYSEKLDSMWEEHIRNYEPE
jgi:transcription elongation factor Elf1